MNESFRTSFRRPVVPAPWRRGMKAGIVNPSGNAAVIHGNRLSTGILHLAEDLGGGVLCTVPDQPFNSYRALSPQAAANELHGYFKRADVALILCSIGGFTTNAVLKYIDWDILRASPKHICGYSDATALLLAIKAMTNQVVLMGPALMPQWGDPRGPMPFTRQSFMNAITLSGGSWLSRPSSEWVDPRIPWDGNPPESIHELIKRPTSWRALRSGTATGQLVGGNVETLNMLIGTPYLPSFRQSLLFLEATGAEAHPPRFHRALVHMRDAGLLDDVRAVLLGRSPELTVDGVDLVESILLDVFPSQDVPVVIDVDFGHTEPALTIPFGLVGTITCGKNRSELMIHAV
ncbi:hypothetical protein B0E51_01260 [Rhodanobacter sp. C05]|nr:hypothetical protein B0E51_01260 [Rhodanobacter sp. C05]